MKYKIMKAKTLKEKKKKDLYAFVIQVRPQ